MEPNVAPAYYVADWREPLIRYIADRVLPTDRKEAETICRRAAYYVVEDAELYRRSFSAPLLRCVGSEEARYILTEVHEGVCGNHTGYRVLAQKVLRAGYYWPTIMKDAETFVRACKQCQLHSNVARAPSTDLRALSSPWPFAQWGLDLLGPFPRATAQRKYVIVAVDYFTKWVEAESLVNITWRACKEFFWKNVICRFGVPNTLITDNDT